MLQKAAATTAAKPVSTGDIIKALDFKEELISWKACRWCVWPHSQR